MTNQKYLKLLRAMTSPQLAMYYARLKRGYVDERICRSSKTKNVAVVMTMHDKLLGSFRCIVYPDGTVEGGKASLNVRLRKDF